MKNFNVVVEDQTTGLTHKLNVDAESKQLAEEKSINHFSDELKLQDVFLEVLICIEVLPSATIKDLKRLDEFVHEETLYQVKKSFTNIKKPLIAYFNNKLDQKTFTDSKIEVVLIK